MSSIFKRKYPFVLFAALAVLLFFLFYGYPKDSAQAVSCNYTLTPSDSIQSALEKAQPGQTICLTSGEYRQDLVSVRNGAVSAPITIKGPANAIIKGAGNARVIEVNHDYLTLDGFTIDGLYGSSSSASGYRDKLLYVIGNDANDGVTGLKVLNMTLKNAGGECIRLKYLAKDNEIAYNNIQNCGAYDFKFNGGGKNGEGVYIGTAPEQLSKNPTSSLDASNNNHIHHNIIDTQGNEGVDIKEGSSGNIIEYNKITGQKDPNSAGMDSRGDGNIFRYNEVTGSVGAGIRFGGDNYEGRLFGKNNSAYGNKLSNNQYGTIKIQVDPQGTICGNELSGNGAGIGTYGKNYNFTASCPGISIPDTIPNPIPELVLEPETSQNPSCHWVLVCDDSPAPSPETSRLQASSVSASSYDERDGGQIPQNTLDGSLATKWSAQGNGEWINYDLGTAKTVSNLKIAFYRGNERMQNFSIQASSDGNSWITIYSGKSSGKSTDFQSFDFPDKAAKYIRIMGQGNSQNDWNSLTEVEIY